MVAGGENARNKGLMNGRGRGRGERLVSAGYNNHGDPPPHLMWLLLHLFSCSVQESR